MPKRKKEEAGVSTGTKKSKKAEESCAKFLSLAATDDSLLAGLTYFLTRVQGDRDSALLSDYLRRHPDCSHVLAPLAWDRERRSLDVLLLCFRCLEQILLYTASTTTLPPVQYPAINSTASSSSSFTKLSHSVGSKLVQAILQNHMRPIYSSLMSTAPTKLTGSCLCLLAAMVTQGPSSAREVQLIFNFGYKALGVLPSRTNKIPGMSDSVRLCFMKFALSFLVVGDSEVIRTVLETRGFLSSFIKLLPKDPPATIHLFLTTLLEKAVLNPTVSKKAKSGFFNQYALKQIAQLLFGKDGHPATAPGRDGHPATAPGKDGRPATAPGKDGHPATAPGRDGHPATTPGRERQQDPAVVHSSPESVELRGVVFEFLVMLCTDFQRGVCYRSKNMPLGLDRTNNPVILQLLLSLSGSVTDPLMRELTTRTVSSCPDLLLSYLRSLSTSFEPRANSRWMANVDFLIKLFSSLPAVPQLLGLEEGRVPPHTHVPISVKFSLPVVTSRGMLSQGILNSTFLVKHETLRLMELILTRAAATVDSLCVFNRNAGADSFLVRYCDSVLKQLPDVKTVVTVRQQLLSGSTSSAQRSEEDELSSQERLKNAELMEDSRLLALALTVLRGYQKLSPSIFAQVDFNVAKLLPSLPPSPTVGPYGNVEKSCDSHVMLPTLLLLLDSPPDSLKWQQQGKATLSSLLWLLLGDDGAVSCLARQVLLKLLLGYPALRSYRLDLEVILAAVQSHQGGAHSSPECTRLLIATLAEAMVSVVREPYAYLEEVEGIMSRRGGERLGGRGADPSLCSLLGSPLEMPVQDTGEVAHLKGELHVGHRSPGMTICPLIPCLLSKLGQVEIGPLLPIISGLLVKLHLVQESYETFARVVLHYFGLETVRENLLLGQHPWNHLSKSLLQFFCCWLHELPSEITAVLENSTLSVEDLSTRKTLKKLAKTPAPDKVLSVLSSLARNDIIECLPEITKMKPLSQTIRQYSRIRPMHLLESLDDPSVSEVLQSLPFTALLLQSTPSSITQGLAPSDSHPPATSALINSLSQANIQALMRSSVDHSEGDGLELMCSVRAILALLQSIFSSCKVSGLCDTELSTVGFCFELLSRIISVTATRLETESAAMYSSLELLSAIFSSRLTKQAFLEAKISSESKSKYSSCEADVVFTEKLGTLLDDALVHCPEFKATPEFNYCTEKLLSCLERFTTGRSNSGQCDLLLSLFKRFAPYVDKKRLLGFCENLVSTSLVSLGSREVELFASVLHTVLLPSSCVEQLYSLDGDGVLVPGVAGDVALSDTAVKRLIEHTLKSNSDKLDCVLFALLLQKTSQLQWLPASSEAASSTCSEADGLVSSVKSLARDLILSSSEELSTELCDVSEACKTHELRRESRAALIEAFSPELATVLSGLQAKTQEKGLLDLRYDETLFVNKSDSDNKLLPLLSEDHAIGILDYCLLASTPIHSKIACLLMENSNRVLEHFTTSPMLPELCETAANETDETKLHLGLYLLERYLHTLVKQQTGEQEELLCGGGWKEAVKVIRKKLWDKCSFLITCGDYSSQLQAVASEVLRSLCSLSSKAKKQLRKLAREWNDDKWNKYQLTLAVEASCCEGDPSFSSLVLGKLLHQLVEVFAETEGPCLKKGEDEEEENLMKLAGRVLKVGGTLSLSRQLDPELWKSFVHTALRKRFTQPAALRLLTALLKAVYCDIPNDLSPAGKLMSLDTIYQMVWSHSEFLHVMCSSHDQALATQLADTKEKLIEVLVTAVDLHLSVGQSTHIAVLLSAYSATRSKTDHGLLYLLYQYEKNGTSVGEYRPFLWGPAALEQYRVRQEVGWLLWKQPDTQEVVEQLDRELLLRSSENFPLYIQLEPTNPFTEGCSDGDTELAETVYDPSFLLPLLSHLLDSSCLVDCRQFVESGCLGYLMSSLSSMCEGVRVAGCHALSRFCTHLEASRSREKLQISLLLEVLRNSLEENSARVPSFFTAFATRTAQLFLHPENKFYSVIAHFLVYKPALDLQEIPLFYMLLHSSSPQHNQERAWLLELLINGLRCEEDYHLYRKKKVLSQAMALHDSPFVDHKCRALILQLVHRACSIPVVATDLVWNQGLLAWLHHVIKGTREKKTLLQILMALWHSMNREHRRADTSRNHSSRGIKVPPLFEEELVFTFSSTLS